MRILAATDFSQRSDRAVRRAGLLARRLGAAVDLVHVVDDDQPQRLVEAARREALALLEEEIGSRAELAGLTVDLHVVQSEPATGLLAAVVDLRADLLVMGPHRRALFKDVFVGTTLERVLRRVGVPVLVANRDGSADYRHVLVAVDLSVDSAAALAAAKALGLLQAVPIEILHVFDPMARGLVSMATHSPQAVEHYVAMSRQEASDALAAFLSTVDFAGVEYTVRVLEGPPAATITQAAQGAGLVVVGTRGRTGAARVFLGSVAEFVVRSVDADVLVARAVRD